MWRKKWWETRWHRSKAPGRDIFPEPLQRDEVHTAGSQWERYQSEISQLKLEEESRYPWWSNENLPEPPLGGWEPATLNNAWLGISRLLPIQLAHTRLLIERLACFGDELETSDLDIRPVTPGFYPLYLLRDRGGPLNDQKLMIVFAPIPKNGKLVVLRLYFGWGELPAHHVALIQDRLQDFMDFDNDINEE